MSRDLSQWAQQLADADVDEVAADALDDLAHPALTLARSLIAVRLRTRSGALSRSIDVHVSRHGQVSMRLATPHPGAALQEHGGTVRGRVIPLTARARHTMPRHWPALFAVRARSGRTLLATRGGQGRLEPQYLIADTRVRGRHFLRDAMRKASVDLHGTLHARLEKEIG